MEISHRTELTLYLYSIIGYLYLMFGIYLVLVLYHWILVLDLLVLQMILTHGPQREITVFPSASRNFCTPSLPGPLFFNAWNSENAVPQCRWPTTNWTGYHAGDPRHILFGPAIPTDRSTGYQITIAELFAAAADLGDGSKETN